MTNLNTRRYNDGEVLSSSQNRFEMYSNRLTLLENLPSNSSYPKQLYFTKTVSELLLMQDRKLAGIVSNSNCK